MGNESDALNNELSDNATNQDDFLNDAKEFFEANKKKSVK